MMIDYMDVLGMIRKTQLFDEYCSITDLEHIKRDVLSDEPLNILKIDEDSGVKNGILPLNRKIPFDIDNDIVICPDFHRRQANSLIVMLNFNLFNFDES